MQGANRSPFRRHAAKGAAILLVGGAAWWNYVPKLSQESSSALAKAFSFERTMLEPPTWNAEAGKKPIFAPGFQPLEKWMRAFLPTGAALADLDGDGWPNEACVTDPFQRTVTIFPTPGRKTTFAAFTLPFAAKANVPGAVVPSGCLTGDFDEDGDVDLLVYFLGRTPLVYLKKDGQAPTSAEAFAQFELTAASERWYTQSITTGDIDGDGRLDLVVGNYFPDKAHVFDDGGEGVTEMNDGWAQATNAAENRLLLGVAGAPDNGESLLFAEAKDVFNGKLGGTQWTIATAAVDMDGDSLPEVFFINDHGPDRLLHNRSLPGKPAFELVKGRRDLLAPKSKTLGLDDFHGMGIDFSDFNKDGRLDWVVPNFGGDYMFHQSHFVWINQGDGLHFRDESESMGLARTKIVPWDTRIADFNNDGDAEVFFSSGFFRGKDGRAAEIQEIAMVNDLLLRHPAVWPKFNGDDDLSGTGANAFFARSPSGRYYDIGATLGFNEAGVSRGASVADVDGDGRLDLLVTNQHAKPSFYRNASASGAFLDLDVRLPYQSSEPDVILVRPRGAGDGVKSRAAVGALVTVDLPGGLKAASVVGGGHGYGGKNPAYVHLGLGQVAADSKVTVHVSWRDARGTTHKSTVEVAPGAHTLWLGKSAEIAGN